MKTGVVIFFSGVHTPMRVAAFAVLSAMTVSLGTVAASASTLTYGNPGTPAPLMSLTAVSSGPVTGYFLGSDAGDTDYVALVDLSTNTHSDLIMSNHGTAPGATANFGTVNAGDQLLLVFLNQTTSTYLTSSDYNYDGLVHAYLRNYAGGVVNGVAVPAGVYVGLEDLLKSQPQADFDYNDSELLLTNVSASPVPEPGSLALLGTGVLSAAGMLRRRLRA